MKWLLDEINLLYSWIFGYVLIVPLNWQEEYYKLDIISIYDSKIINSISVLKKIIF